jgi:glycosyltransferase involved in cell wall biosynthesis
MTSPLLQPDALLRSPGPPPVTTALFAAGDASRHLPTIRSLRAAVEGPLVIGGPSARQLLDLTGGGADAVPADDPGDLLHAVWQRSGGHVLLVGEPVLFPPCLLEPALAAAEADLRVGTVSFLSNAAGPISFPFRGTPVDFVANGQGPGDITGTLRALAPSDALVPLVHACGSAVLLTASLIGALPEPDLARWFTFAGLVAEVSMQGRRRGFLDLADLSTYVHSPADLRAPHEARSLSGGDLERLGRNHPTTLALAAHELGDELAPVNLAHRVARVKVEGLRLLLDGSCLGPFETGTQVNLIELVGALTARDDVSRVAVTLPGPMPTYAARTLGHPKVQTVPHGAGPAGWGERADVAYRAFQPDAAFDVARFRAVADRVVVSLLDLIAYRIGSYAGDGEAWLRYRETIRDVAAAVDAITVLSDDVARAVHQERLPVDPSRVSVVPCGTEHVSDDHRAEMPILLDPARFAAAPFLLCLGTDFTHKNRDLAVRTTVELERRGWDLPLVLAGPSVTYGSSRIAEALLLERGAERHVVVLPNVTTAERNWLLRHASVLLYPTSAEGFGLVPFEAGRFGTPSVHVPFGPLAEFTGALPVSPSAWDPVLLADAVEQLLRDPALAARQVEAILESGARFTWPDAAERLTTLFRTLLSEPPTRRTIE